MTAGGDGEHAALSSGDAALLGGLAGAISATFTCPLVCCSCSRERPRRAPSHAGSSAYISSLLLAR